MRKLTAYRKDVLYFLRNAPLAVFTSALPGLLNYVIILILVFFYDMEDAGQYRLLISYYALMRLFSFQESSKVLVRSEVMGEAGTSASLFIMRLYGIGLALIILLVIWGWEINSGYSTLPIGLIPIALLACISYPADLYIPYLQAEKRFSFLAGISFLNYMCAFGCFIALTYIGYDVVTATICQIGVMAVFNLSFFTYLMGRKVLVNMEGSLNPVSLIKNKNIKEAFTLSLANWLPNTLEHADKMIIGYVFGLKTLGLYTLAFSTGRFIYNAMKPAFYIYYRHFVDMLPGKKLLSYVMGAGSLFGLGLCAVFAIALIYIPSFEKFSGAEPVVYIIFASYGIALVSAIYTQSYGINKETKSLHLLISNTITGLLCLSLFAASALMPWPIALIMCACHFPLKHSGTVFFLSILKARAASYKGMS